MHVIFQKKGQIKGQKGENIGKFGQKCTKSENILKQGSFMGAAIACMKQLQYTLSLPRIFICTTLRSKIFICIFLGQRYNKKSIVYQNTIKYTSSPQPN